MSSIHDQQTEDLRFRVLKLLQERPDISQRDLARQLGISHGKMNYCLKALMDKGLVKLENFQNSQHKFNYAYLLTPAGISEKAALTGRFLKRKMAEYEPCRPRSRRSRPKSQRNCRLINNWTVLPWAAANLGPGSQKYFSQLFISSMDLTNKTIAIIGMGYVGLPLTVEFGKVQPVIGFDINAARIRELQGGQINRNGS